MYNTKYKAIKNVTVYQNDGTNPAIKRIIPRGSIWQLIWCGGQHSMKELTGKVKWGTKHPKVVTVAFPDSYIEKYFKKV